MKLSALCAAAALGLVAAPLSATSQSLPERSSTRQTELPRQLSSGQAEQYRAIFAAIRAEDWSGAAARLDATDDGLLHGVARAELFLAKNSPRVERDPLLALIARWPDMPRAGQLTALAKKRGATGDMLPTLPEERKLAWLGSAPRRQSAASIKSDLIAADYATKALPLLKADKPGEAEALLNQVAGQLSPEALTEWRQRIAWTYFLEGYDPDALRLARQARAGAGEWTVQADWVAGLAAWRARDCEEAGKAFSAVAAKARDPETTAAGLFWTARADMACGHPERVQPRMRSAARLPETFYGLLAAGYLGHAVPAPERRPTLAEADWKRIEDRANVRRALALIEIGEDKLASDMLRHQAKIGDPAEHDALLRLAVRLDLPNDQIWFAQNGPAGAKVATVVRYPQPGWAPPPAGESTRR